MQFYEDNHGFVFELTLDETNDLFEPFTSHHGMGMVDFKNRHRFLKQSYREWLTNMVGQEHEKWWTNTLDANDGTYEIWFAERRHAMVFKLLKANIAA